MEKYRLYDMYDYMGIVLSKNNRIGEYTDMEAARRAAANYDRDCDGECAIFICKLNPEQGKFLAIDAEPMVYDVEEDW